MTAHGPAAEPPEPPADPFAGTPHEGSPEGWWTPYGGALDQASGVVHIPRMTEASVWTGAAEALADEVTAGAPAWHDAVRNTLRHLLVPRWWRRIPNSPAREWELADLAEDSPERLHAAYTDETLVTRVGPTHADHAAPGERGKGDPTSSSTLPGLIVSMAHRLDVQPGHKVLDVGTGSGYSAGLFARRFGDENVTSVDVDPYLVEAARTRLAGFGRTPRLAAVDATGELPEPEYDRIMATVSVRPVPASWLRALRPGGRLVTTIAHTALLITAATYPDDGRRVVWLLAPDGSWVFPV
ncbi:methyltransferase domain-containing protein [Streptomyces celluloflavus]|uniref:methyltransferase domain-containing protein n=1 Tax=Streptomyces celluloflavus TaxID=58344 RepID=UPI0036C29999